MLQVSVEYKTATADDDIYFMAANIRQNLISDKENLALTTLQKMFSVLNCKARMEKAKGEMRASSELS